MFNLLFEFIVRWLILRTLYCAFVKILLWDNVELWSALPSARAVGSATGTVASGAEGSDASADLTDLVEQRRPLYRAHWHTIQLALCLSLRTNSSGSSQTVDSDLLHTLLGRYTVYSTLVYLRFSRSVRNYYVS